jgi:hypothetical protein
MLKNPTNTKMILRRQNSVTISSQVSPPSLLDVSAGNCQTAVVDESGIIRIQMEGAHWIRNGRSARDSLCAHPVTKQFLTLSSLSCVTVLANVLSVSSQSASCFHSR